MKSQTTQKPIEKLKASAEDDVQKLEEEWRWLEHRGLYTAADLVMDMIIAIKLLMRIFGTKR